MKILLLLALVWLAYLPLFAADAPAVPGGAFNPSRYQPLWDSSPFSVATPVVVESAQYALVGAAKFEGISYASVIDKSNQDHFVVTSSAPSHGLSLVTLEHGATADSTSATLSKDGTMLRLRLEPQPAGNLVPISTAPPTSPLMSIPSVDGLPHRGPPRARRFRPPVYVPTPSAPTSSP